MILFYFFIFPGILTIFILGGIASWIERKLTAKLQARVGPPFLQPFYDIQKLFIKEMTIPKDASKGVFVLSPFISFAAISVVGTIVLLAILNPKYTFKGDVIVCIYLLLIVSVALILGGGASSNPLSSLGASREMKLVLSYDVCLWSSLSVGIIKSGEFTLNGLIEYQKLHGAIASSLSGIIAFIVAIICMQAKFGKVPFDIPEAEQELAGGIFVEYGGPLLGFIKITQYMMLIVLPLFLLEIFWSPLNSWITILKYLLLLFIIIVMENVNPRLRIDQAMSFCWLRLFPLSVLAIILAILGI